ncbi:MULTISPECIES: hypothetical protein [Mameliella]|uniref:hypothetical protein n=1 Tax=Mameliella TaxID=1434019 RepID=UPI000841136C|nr:MULTISPECIES: hypothetical protein [Mameliella]ODM45417.1 hypothetical protein A9320_10305 [Ruegeria sp. PBVC088]MBY6120220.1 hypothetical protein [Mameliella alba]OWV45706.1 hypothetical protein CDZ95_01775 [Mameliella alba]OWV49520.1 hypothetical protein CDZ96_03840 [Mameliella alba]OWV64279.1 hypothetical protein CDZ97_10370 [Mameliella alba]
MTMNIRFLPLALPLLLAACVEYAEVKTPPQSVSFTESRAQAAVRGYSETTFRSFRSTEKGRKDNQELVGVRCSLTGTGFKAAFVTPAIVKMPAYQGAADPIAVTCRTDKDRTDKTVKPINMTLLRMNQSSTTSGGILGVALTAAAKGIAKAARDPLKDEFNYPVNIHLVLGVED